MWKQEKVDVLFFLVKAICDSFDSLRLYYESYGERTRELKKVRMRETERERSNGEAPACRFR